MPGDDGHQDGSRHAWLEGEAPLDLIPGSSPGTTLDDATGAIYSAFLVEEGAASTFRALKEVFSRTRPAGVDLDEILCVEVERRGRGR